MELLDLNYGNLLYIAQRMRQLDREEIYATRWEDDPKKLASDAMLIPQMSWIAASHGEPVAAGGAIPVHPCVWSVWMFATDKWPSVALGSTKKALSLISHLQGPVGATRIECKSHHLHVVAHKWLEFLGARCESRIHKYGKNGEDFFVFAWTQTLNNK